MTNIMSKNRGSNELKASLCSKNADVASVKRVFKKTKILFYENLYNFARHIAVTEIRQKVIYDVVFVTKFAHDYFEPFQRISWVIRERKR